MDESWVADDRGCVWPASEPALRRSLSTDLAPGPLGQFAARNAGFVTISRSHLGWRLWLRERLVAPEAITGTLSWLVRSDVGAAVVSVFDGTRWQDQICGSFDRITQVLVVHIEATGNRLPLRFLCQPAPEPRPGDDTSLWKLAHGLRHTTFADSREVASFCDILSGGRYTIAEIGQDNGLIIRETGRGYTVYTPSYLESAVGRRIEDEPDAEYGVWVASSLRDLATRSEPSIQNVDVLIRGSRARISRVRYRRVVGRISAGGGQTLLVSASRLDPSIDLRKNVAA